MLPTRTRSENFFNVDAAWLRMDTPSNMVMITALLMFDEPLDYNRFRKSIECRLLSFPRFKQRVRDALLPFTLPRWEDDPCFDLDAHLHRVALPSPADETTLREVVEDRMRQPLHPDRPLWQMDLVENVGTGSAVICRLSHAIADGVALMDVMNTLTDTEPDLPDPEPKVRKNRGFAYGLLKKAIGITETSMRITETLVRESAETIQRPRRLLDAAEFGLDGARSLAKLLFTLPDAKTPLKGPCGRIKRAVASQPLALKDVKAAGKILGGTVNDIILTAVAGGFRHYLENLGEPVEGVEIRAFVPVYIGNGASSAKMGNGFGLTLLTIPVGVADPIKRLRLIKDNMDEIKNSPEAMVAYGILFGMGWTPKIVDQVIAKIFGMKATAVMTNVVGPGEVRYLAGKPIKRLMFWVPQPAGLGIGLSIMSYAGDVIVGLATDAGLIPDPEIIIEGFHAEMNALQQRAEIRRRRFAAKPVETQVEEKPSRCRGVTKEGKPCQSTILVRGTDYCKAHQQG